MSAPRTTPLSRFEFLRVGSGAIAAAALAGCGAVAQGNLPQASLPQASLPQAPAFASDDALESASLRAMNATVGVSRSQMVGNLPAMLAGLSYEKLKISTPAFTTASTGLISLFQRLGPSVLRIGGNSVDQTTWTPNGPGATAGQVAPSDIAAFGAFVKAVNWRVIYGINLATNTPAAAAAEAACAARALGASLLAFEIGNECDQYPINGLRPRTYDLQEFIAEWTTYVAAIRQAVPNAPLSGPASAANVTEWTVPFAASEASQLQMLTQHYYMGANCNPTPTVSELLAGTSYLPSMLSDLQAAVRANPIAGGFRLAEANSFWDGGTAGVSNSYGSALWAVDFLMTTAMYGCAGANFHGGGDWSYNPYYTPIADDNGTVLSVNPVYYGMLFVAQIAPGPMYAVDLSAKLEMSSYAVAGNDGATYVVLINKDPGNAAQTTVNVESRATLARVLQLTGTGLTATTGTKLGGVTVGNDGSWQPRGEESFRMTGSKLSIRVPAAAAMLLKIT